MLRACVGVSLAAHGGRAHPFTVRVLLRVRFAVGSDDAWSATTRDVAAPCQTWRRTFAHAHLTRCHACRCPGLDTKPCLVPVCRALGHHVCVQGVPDCTEAKGALPCDFCESLKFLSPCVLCCAFPAHKELSVVVHAPEPSNIQTLVIQRLPVAFPRSSL